MIVLLMGLLLACIFQPSSAHAARGRWLKNTRKKTLWIDNLHLEQAGKHYPNQFVEDCKEETSKSETH